MKKIFMALMLCLISVVAANAQNTIYGYTTNCLIWNEYTRAWENIENGQGIQIAITSDSWYINSAQPQSFRVYNVSEWHINASGHKQYTCNGLDQDGHMCTMRVVERTDSGCEAPWQLYITYNNISYVYNFVLY